MLLNCTSVLARLLGLGFCLLSTGMAAFVTLVILATLPQASWWAYIIAFPLLGLAAWGVTSLGEWLWSFEEGWFGLQRCLRLIQVSLIGGGQFCALGLGVGLATGILPPL